MDIAVTSDKEEKLFSRRAITFTLAYGGATPSKGAARTELCKKLNLMPALTVITGIGQDYGSRSCRASAHSYSSKEALERFERRHITARLSKKEGKERKEEAAKPEQKEEKAKKEGKESKEDGEKAE